MQHAFSLKGVDVDMCLEFDPNVLSSDSSAKPRLMLSLLVIGEVGCCVSAGRTRRRLSSCC